MATGSILDKPQGNWLVQFVNMFNLFFLLVLNPLVAMFMIADRLATIDATRIIIDELWLLIVFEIMGWLMYVGGYLLMAGALITLGQNYQLGGNTPRAEDKMVINGPYRLVRHPMYTAVMSISLGLTGLIQSWACFAVFCIYLALISLLIPVEEDGLRKVYGEPYVSYQQKTRRLIPFVY